MREPSFWDELGHVWSSIRLWLRLKWVQWTYPFPRVRYKTFYIQPEGVMLRCPIGEVDANGGEEGGPTIPWSSWEGRAYFPFLEAKASISLSVAGAEPRPEQIEFLRSLVQHRPSLRSAIELEVYEYYQSQVYGNYDAYDGAGRNVTRLTMPKLNSPREIRRLIWDPIISFDEHDVPSQTFEIEYQSTWWPDAMHGVRIKIQAWQIKRVSG